jgi:hypothetical protein
MERVHAGKNAFWTALRGLTRSSEYGKYASG